jgi:hypothetical protein
VKEERADVHPRKREIKKHSSSAAAVRQKAMRADDPELDESDSGGDMDPDSGLKKATKMPVKKTLRNQIEADEIGGQQKFRANEAARREEVESKLGEAASDDEPKETEKKPSAVPGPMGAPWNCVRVPGLRGVKLKVWDGTDDSGSDVKQKKKSRKPLAKIITRKKE